jgi:hypothetical protein
MTRFWLGCVDYGAAARHFIIAVTANGSGGADWLTLTKIVI